MQRPTANQSASPSQPGRLWLLPGRYRASVSIYECLGDVSRPSLEVPRQELLPAKEEIVVPAR